MAGALAFALAACSMPDDGASNDSLSRGADLGTPDPLTVLNQDGGGNTLRVVGPEGGPFPSGERTYTLTNNSDSVIDWVVRSQEDWILFSGTEGTLNPGQSYDIRGSIDQAIASSLAPGEYESAIAFLHNGGSPSEIFQGFLLIVTPATNDGPELVVWPGTPFHATGTVGDSITPDEQAYVLKNVGDEELSWSIDPGASWVQCSATAGVLAPGERTNVQFSLDVVALMQLGEGDHASLARFHNVVDGSGDTTRRITVDLDAASDGGRVTDGLVTFYDFEEGSGGLVGDRLPGSNGLDLVVENPSAIEWIQGGVRIASPTRLATSGPATALTQAITSSGELTFEAWIRPANTTQEGPARILTLSGGSSERNVTLGQGLWGDLPSTGYNARLRTTTTDLDGMPLRDTGPGHVRTELTHVVLTRAADGTERIYVDGQVACETNTAGNLSNWNSGYRFAIGNEIGVERPWLGDVHLVATYDRALAQSEVQQNFAAGPQDPQLGALSVSPAIDFNVTGVLGGGLSATEMTYSVSNTGTAALTWSVDADEAWIGLDGPSGGSLQPGDSADIVVTLDPNVAFSLGEGYHEGHVAFVNETTGLGDATRTVRLQIQQQSGGGGVSNHPVLQPGSGWSGATNEPGQIGTGPGADRKTVARWDVVQAQDVTGLMEIGLLAFHTNGIQRVEMAVDGGAWSEISLMEVNPRTGVSEYWFYLDPSLFQEEGLAEVRAIAYPTTGKPRLLQSLRLNVFPSGVAPQPTKYVAPYGSDSSGNGTQAAPYHTISKAAQVIQAQNGGLADGGLILLEEGDYTISATPIETRDRYLTIAAAPGASRAATRITGHESYGLDTDRLRLSKVTLRTYMDTSSYVGHYLWLDQVHQKGNGQWSSSGPGSSATWLPAHFPWNWMGMTDCEVSDARFGPTMSYFQRGTYIHHIGEDVFRYPAALIDVRVAHVNPGTSGWHADMIEISGGYTNENMLIYNLNATDVNAQGLFVKAPGGQTTTLRDSAMVNTILHKTDNVWSSQFASNSSVTNMLFLNCTFANMSFGVRSPGVSKIDFRNCVISQIYANDGGTLVPSWFNDCHFISGDPIGNGASAGNPSNLFQSASSLDFSPGPGSPLRDRTNVTVSHDLHNTTRSAPASIGALED